VSYIIEFYKTNIFEWWVLLLTNTTLFSSFLFLDLKKPSIDGRLSVPPPPPPVYQHYNEDEEDEYGIYRADSFDRFCRRGSPDDDGEESAHHEGELEHRGEEHDSVDGVGGGGERKRSVTPEQGQLAGKDTEREYNIA